MNPLLPLEYLVPLLAAAGLLGLWTAWRSTVGCRPRLRLLLIVLRAVLMVGLGLVALNPGRWMRKQVAGVSEWALLVDRSASMTTEDVDGRSRWRAALAVAGRVVDRIPEGQRVRLYSFAEGLEHEVAELSALEALVPDGEGSDLDRAGRELLELTRESEDRLKGVLVLSDGRRVGSAVSERFGIRALADGVPVHTVCTGGAVRRRDLAITAGRRQYVRFPGQALHAAVTLVNEGLGNIRTSVDVLSADGSVQSQHDVDLENDARQSVQVPLPDSENAYVEYSIRVAPRAGETVLHNNMLRVGVSRLDREIEVLLVEGEPHWDSKFIVQLLRRQSHIKLTTVHRVTSERFFRVGQAGGDVASDTTVFPQTAEALAPYDVIMFGKGVEYFLDEERIRLVDHFVRQRGGCVLFCRGKPYQGALDALARLEPVEWGTGQRGEWRWEPTLSGEQEGLFGQLLPGREDAVWQNLSPVARVTGCKRVKSFSQVLAAGLSEGHASVRTMPLVISRRYGSGMVVTVNAEGMWQWDFFPRFAASGDLYKRFWVGMVQWMTTRTGFLPGRGLSVRLTASQVAPGLPVKVVVDSRERQNGAGLLVRVCKGDQVVRELNPRSAESTDERYEAVFALGEPGDYRVEAEWGDQAAQSLLHVTAPLGERDELSADPAALRELAMASGGLALGDGALEPFLALLEAAPETAAAGLESWHALWDRAVWMLLLLAAGLTEWTVRRRSGLL